MKQLLSIAIGEGVRAAHRRDTSSIEQRSTLPLIIQGGMGAAVSNWRLANAVARTGQLGVVSGTGIDTVFVRRLQDGDLGGHMRRGMEQFPIRRAADEAMRRYYRPEGRAPGEPYTMLPLYRQVVAPARQELTMLAAFVEVFLAREGHDAPVGINLLTKIQLLTLPTLYGAMLAGVGYVLMGAGIPREIAGALDLLAGHHSARLRFDVEGLPSNAVEYLDFDPSAHWETPPAPLARPKFFPIVASNSLATMLARKAIGQVDGFVIEGPTAGGHNAPPRGEPWFNERGEPIYSKRDEVDLAKIRELGLPFWVAGGAGHPDRLVAARKAGAAGVQVGTLFAFCDESGLTEPIKRSVLAHAARGEVDVRTAPRASPTGFPIKVVEWAENPAVGATRERICDLGYLRTAFTAADGKVDYRCPSEPEAAYVKKGGKMEDTIGRQCLCNALLSVIGHPQTSASGTVEPPIVTSGDDLATIGGFLDGRTSYTAADVVAYLLSGVVGPQIVRFHMD
jgi:NAD(P)H-dependent flavin oxidoreductase YrpB (nitropropane dioxygenase family)